MIILASGSPRRRELLTQMGYEFEIITSDADETPSKEVPSEIVEELSMRKAKEVFEKSHEKYGDDNILIIAADTLVFKGEKRMGKPKDVSDAKRMLKELSGSTHQVYTGVSLIYEKAGKTVENSFFEKTDVIFCQLTDEEIDEYIETKEPMDKAGAYAIQGKSAKFITGINGEYANVVGLPVARLYQEIKKIGYIR